MRKGLGRIRKVGQTKERGMGKGRDGDGDGDGDVDGGLEWGRGTDREPRKSGVVMTSNNWRLYVPCTLYRYLMLE